MSHNSTSIIQPQGPVSSSLISSSPLKTSLTPDITHSLGYGLGKWVRRIFDQIGSLWSQNSHPTAEELLSQRQLQIYGHGLSESSARFHQALDYLQMNPKDLSALKKIRSIISDFALYLKPTDNTEMQALQEKALQSLREKISTSRSPFIKYAVRELFSLSPLSPIKEFSDETSSLKDKRSLEQLIQGASVFNLNSLNGANGFSIVGNIGLTSLSSLGDINGDGITDLFIGSPYDLPNPSFPYWPYGSARVLFGSSSPWPAQFNLTTLNGVNGFEIVGYETDDYLGWIVSSIQDINGDGMSDLALSASTYPSNPSLSVPGSVYVVFGNKGTWPAQFNVSALNGTDGFAVYGISVGDDLGDSLSDAGDINGDGIGDFVLGAPGSSPAGLSGAGSAYVLFGRRGGWPAVFDLTTLNGKNGFTITGLNANDELGTAVSSAGDINGDGMGDLAVGARDAPSPPPYFGKSGATYVMFGQLTWPPKIDLTLLNGANGFVISSGTYYNIGQELSHAGDINGDGISDLLLGAPYDSVSSNLFSSGRVHVLFGNNSGWPARFDPINFNGRNGFTITGLDSFDYLGESVASAGDINGDGLMDILIGAETSPQGIFANAIGPGAVYVLFGQRSGWSAQFNLNTLDGTNGFLIAGQSNFTFLGSAVSIASDLNHDGKTDFAFLSPRQAYVVFGANSYPVTPTYVPIPSSPPSPAPASPASAPLAPPGLNITLTPEAIIGLSAGGGGLVFFAGLLTLILTLRAKKKGCFAPKAPDPGRPHLEILSPMSLRKLDAYV